MTSDPELDDLLGIKQPKIEKPSLLNRIFGTKPKKLAPVDPNTDPELDDLLGIKQEVPKEPSVLDNIKESAKGFLNKGFEKIGKNEQILAEGLPQAVNKPLYEPEIEEPKTYPQALKNVAKGFASSLTTPAGMAGMLAGPVGAAALAPTMGIGAYEEGKEAKKAFEEGNNPKALQHGLASAMTAGLPLLALKGGPRDIEPSPLKTIAPENLVEQAPKIQNLGEAPKEILPIESSKPGLFKQPQEKLPIQEIQNSITQNQENVIQQASQVIPEPVPVESSVANIKPQEILQQKPIPEEIVTPVSESIQPETKTRSLSLGVQEKAIENKLTESLGDLPEYKVVNMKDQALKASDILKNDPEKARRIAFGEEAPPEGILPESLFVAVEDQAIKNGDVETIKKMASSSLTGEATLMGQRIRTLAERNPESPVTAIKEIQRIREEVFKRRNLKDINKVRQETIKQIRNEMTKRAPTKETWASFVESIKC